MQSLRHLIPPFYIFFDFLSLIIGQSVGVLPLLSYRLYHADSSKEIFRFREERGRERKQQSPRLSEIDCGFSNGKPEHKAIF